MLVLDFYFNFLSIALLPNTIMLLNAKSCENSCHGEILWTLSCNLFIFLCEAALVTTNWVSLVEVVYIVTLAMELQLLLFKY